MAHTPLTKLPPAERDKRIAELVKNPGTRASVPTNLLPAAFRRMREQNQRLKQPIVPGSTLTNRDLGQQANAAVTEKYGPAEQQANQDVTAAQQRERDVAGYYDAYLKDLAAHQANVQQINDSAAGQIAGLANIQAPADQAPQDAGNQDTAAKAQAIREALLGAMKGQLVGEGRAASTYADTLANIVGPGQKLGAQTRAAQNTTTARGTLGEIAREKGAYRTDYEQTAKTNESKNVLARQALNLQGETAAANIADKAASRKAAAKTNDNKVITSGPLTGLTNAEARSLTPADRNSLIAGAKTPEKTLTSGPFAGLTQSEIQRHSRSWIKHQVDAYSNRSSSGSTDAASQYAKDFYRKYGVKPASTDAVGSARDDIQKASSYVDELAAAGWSRQEIGQQLLQGGKVQTGTVDTGKKDSNGKKIVKPVYKTYPKLKGLWLTTALDLHFMRGVSNGTADRLHRTGYSVRQLGLSSAASSKPNISQGTGNPASSVGTGLG